MNIYAFSFNGPWGLQEIGTVIAETEEQAREKITDFLVKERNWDWNRITRAGTHTPDYELTCLASGTFTPTAAETVLLCDGEY